MGLLSLPGGGDLEVTGGATEPRDLSRRRPRSIHLFDVLVFLASAASALCATWFVFFQLTPFSGAAGFVICWIASFLAIYYACSRQLLGKVEAVDRTVGALVGLGTAAVIVPLCLVIGFLVDHGYHLISVHFFTHQMLGVPETAPASAGGIEHAIVGTLEQVGIATAIGAPAGVATAIYLNEVRGRLAAVIRTVITAMSALPSIVAGLFIYVFFLIEFHQSFAGIWGSLALSIMLLPNVTRTTEEVLKVVHGSLREAAMALGAPDWRTVWSVVLPTARTGIATAVLLGVARVVGETAPLLVTVSSNAAVNANPFSNPQEALPIFVFQMHSSSRLADLQRSFSAGLALVGIVLVLFITARLLASINPGAIGRLRERLVRQEKA
jgi:phosphate transport system permease protein